MAQLALDADPHIDWENLPVKGAYVMGFAVGDMVQTMRDLHPVNGQGRSIPAYGIGIVQGIDGSLARVSFLFWGDHWVRIDDLEYATDYHLIPVRLDGKRKDGSKA